MIFIILTVIMIAGIFVFNRARSEVLEISAAVLSWSSGILLAIFLVILLFSYPISLDTVSRSSNFYNRNYAVWTYALEKYPTAVQIETKGETAKVTNITRYFLDEVLNYNETLQWYRTYQNHWLYAPFISKMPDELKFLEIPK